MFLTFKKFAIVRSSRLVFTRVGQFFALCAGISFATAETWVATHTQIGTTPRKLGYNLGHFMSNSNAADWFRYSGVDAARVFISPSDIEPNDDLAPVGDGVSSELGFFNRINLLRANAASKTESLSSSFVNWNYFANNYAKIATGNNRMQIGATLATLDARGVSILVNLTASPSRFPVAGPTDWPAQWELWQHYYAHAFLLSRDYNVSRFSMFNEPNGWLGMTESDWVMRYRICSDAIQSAVSDMSSRYSRNLVAQVYAPNTANGFEKYNSIGLSEETTDTWGRDAIVNRHLRLDGSSTPGWMNLHVYNYQKYTTRQIAANGLSGYINDYDTLRGLIDADMPGEPQLPIALTEFNVRTGANYDTSTATQDSPIDFTSLGANCIALAERGASEIYVFKFGQTANPSSVYGVAKNGTHYVENGTSGNNRYGGATQCAEVYRLFVKAARGGRPRLGFTTSAGAGPKVNAGVWSLLTHDVVSDTYYAFLSNQETEEVPIEFDFSQLPVAANQAVFVEEVSAMSSGGISRIGALIDGKLGDAIMPAQSVWLITVPAQTVRFSSAAAVADAQLCDGAAKNLPGGSVAQMEVRADGTLDGRKVSLIRIPVPTSNASEIHSVFLKMNVATTSGTQVTRAHVYGVDHSTWQEMDATWATTASLLRQSVPAGNLISNNVVVGQGTSAMILGQLLADSPNFSEKSLDVTYFVKSRTDGFASFLIVQDHRWDRAQPTLTVGDTQAAGLLIESRESATAPSLVSMVVGIAPTITSEPLSKIVELGESTSFQVTAIGSEPIGYQWLKDGAPIPGAVSSTYMIPSTGAASIGSYQVLLTNSFGSASSAVADLHVTASAVVAREATIRGGTSADMDQDEAAIGYLSVKHSSSANTRRKSYFQFDLPEGVVDLDAPATFKIRFHQAYRHRVRLWGLKQPYLDFASTVTWNTARANDLFGNDMLVEGNDFAVGIGEVDINPGSELVPYDFEIARLGDFVFENRLTLVLSGVLAGTNDDAGMRISRGASTLSYSMLAPGSPPTLSSVPDQWVDEDTPTEPIVFSVSDLDTALDDLVVRVSSSNQVLVPDRNLILEGSGGERRLRVVPAANQSGTVTLSIAVSDGATEVRESFELTVRPDRMWTNWRQLKFGDSWRMESLSGPAADLDHDGVMNLLEYALRGDPGRVDLGILPTGVRVADGFEFRFSREFGATDLRLIVQVADHLTGIWEDVAVSNAGNSFVPLIPDLEVSVDATEISEEVVLVDRRPSVSRRFMRLRVELLNP